MVIRRLKDEERNIVAQILCCLVKSTPLGRVYAVEMPSRKKLGMERGENRTRNAKRNREVTATAGEGLETELRKIGLRLGQPMG